MYSTDNQQKNNKITGAKNLKMVNLTPKFGRSRAV